MSDNSIGRFHGFRWYDHLEDKAILAWLEQQQRDGLSETVAIKKALYLVASGQIESDDVARDLSQLRDDVQAIRGILSRGVVLSDDARDDDDADIATAFGNVAT